MITVKFLELAKDEMADTFETFEYKQKNLGYAFVDEIILSLECIKVDSEVWTKSSLRTQRCLLQNFPYSITYQKKDDAILVVAISSLLKAPLYCVSVILSEQRMSKSKQIPIGLYMR